MHSMGPYDPEQEVTVRVPMKFARGRIADMICNAMEGGSTYWLMVVNLQDGKASWPEGCEYMSDVIASGLARWVFYTEEDDLDSRYPEATVAGALSLMAREFPEQFQLFVLEQDDADTADIFFQLLCFGEIVYG